MQKTMTVTTKLCNREKELASVHDGVAAACGQRRRGEGQDKSRRSGTTYDC